MKKFVEKFPNIDFKDKYLYYGIIFGMLFLSMCMNIIYIINMENPILLLNENQILYIYSTSAQVVAGLYGLTLTGYIYLNDKLGKLEVEYDTLIDVVKELREQYFKQITVLGIGCVLGIGLCISLLGALFNIKNNNLFSFLLNQTTIIVVFEIVGIILFSWKMANPRSIEKANQKLLKENEFNQEQKGNLEEFLKKWNSIESKVKELGKKYIYNRQDEDIFKNKYKSNIIEILNLLLSLEILNKDQYYQINELRKYRNSVVHSPIPSVSTNSVRIAQKIETEITEIYNKRMESR